MKIGFTETVGTLSGWVSGLVGFAITAEFQHFVFASVVIPAVGALVGFLVTRILKRIFPEK